MAVSPKKCLLETLPKDGFTHIRRFSFDPNEDLGLNESFQTNYLHNSSSKGSSDLSNDKNTNCQCSMSNIFRNGDKFCTSSISIYVYSHLFTSAYIRLKDKI